MKPPRLGGRSAPIIGERRWNASAARWLAIAAAVALASACGRGGDWRTPAGAGKTADSAAGYVSPPRFTAADRRADGQVEIVGRAQPNAHIQLATPDGTVFAAVTDSRGAFSLAVSAAPAVRLFGLSETEAGRPVRGEGYLAILPTPGRPAAVLRAGAGAQALSPPAGKLALTAVDFDSGGGAVVSGLARPGAPVRLTVDNGAGGETRADADGRFSFTLAAALKPGDHVLVVQSANGRAQARIQVSPGEAISGVPFRGRRQSGGWRIDWLTPAGGEQTTLILD
ncbi:MAG TPA: Ig-like domain-containing protein [Caulobacteraceae bacterium]|nr:Ig-like domain-containing protein [Caulobacteraceae bacterium]